MIFDISNILSARQVEIPTWLSKVLETAPNQQFKEQIIALYQVAQKTQDSDLIGWLQTIEQTRQSLLYSIPFSDKLSYIDTSKIATINTLKTLLLNLIFTYIANLLPETKRVLLTEKLFKLFISKLINTVQVFEIDSYSLSTEDILSSLIKHSSYFYTESISAAKYIKHMSDYNRTYKYELDLKPYIRLTSQYIETSKHTPSIRIDKCIENKLISLIITLSNDKYALVRIPSNLLQAIDQTEDTVVYQGIDMPIAACILHLNEFFTDSDVPLTLLNPLTYDIANLRIKKKATILQISRTLLPFLTEVSFIVLTPENIKYTQLGQINTIDNFEIVKDTEYSHYNFDNTTDLLLELYKLPKNSFNPFLFAISIAEGIRTFIDLINTGFFIDRSDVAMNTFLDIDITLPYKKGTNFREVTIPYQHSYVPVNNKTAIKYLLDTAIRELPNTEDYTQSKLLEEPISLNHIFINDKFFVYIPDFINTQAETVYTLPFWTLFTNDIKKPIIHFTLHAYTEADKVIWTVEDKYDIDRGTTTTEETIEVNSYLIERIKQYIETSKPSVSIYRLKKDKPIYVLEIVVPEEYAYSVEDIEMCINNSEYKCNIHYLDSYRKDNHIVFKYIVYIPVIEYVLSRQNEREETNVDSFLLGNDLFEHMYLNLNFVVSNEDRKVVITYNADFNMGTILWKLQLVDFFVDVNDNLFMFAPVSKIDRSKFVDVKLIDDICEEIIMLGESWEAYITYLLQLITGQYKMKVLDAIRAIDANIQSFIISNAKFQNIPYHILHTVRTKFFEYYISSRIPLFGLDEQKRERRIDRNYNLITDSYIRMTIK